MKEVEIVQKQHQQQMMIEHFMVNEKNEAKKLTGNFLSDIGNGEKIL